jgi:hypothetical protein
MNIEEKILNNRDAFDQSEPHPGHLDKFREKLEGLRLVKEESFFEKHNLIIRIAAGFIIFITIGILLYSGSFSGLRNLLSERLVAANLPAEMIEVMEYYNIVTTKKISQIDALAVSEDEAERVKGKAYMVLEGLEAERLELEKEYASNTNNERILSALVINQRKKSEILDKILNTLNQVK